MLRAAGKLGALRCWRPVFPLAVGAAVAPVLAVLAPLGMAPLFILVGCCGIALDWRNKPWRGVWSSPGLLILAIAVWGGASSLWAIDGLHTLRTAMVFSLQAGGGLMLVSVARCLPEGDSRLLARAMVGGALAGIGLLAVETFTPGVIHFLLDGNGQFSRSEQLARLSRGQTVAALFVFPAVLALWRSRQRRLALLLAIAALLVLMPARPLAARLALLFGGVTWAFVLWRPRLFTRVLAVAAVVLAFSMPALVLLPAPQKTFDAMPWLPSSAHHRLTIWNFAAQRTLEHPLIGWGMDSARSMPGGEDEVIVVMSPPPDERHYVEQLMPLHPHNAFVQVWMELGVPGAVLAAILVAVLMLRAGRLDRIDAAAALATLTAALVVALVSFGIWQSWWQCSFILAAVLLGGQLGRPREMATEGM